MEVSSPTPPSHPERSRNLASVFGAAIALGPAVRGELIAATGLSKATVSRMVDELVKLGLLVESSAESSELLPPDPAHRTLRTTERAESISAAARGRKPTLLSVPRSAGQVIGVSLGLQRTGVLATDLAGQPLSWQTESTPHWGSAEEAASWLSTHIMSARDNSEAPLLRVVVAIPARIIDGRKVSRPPLSMAVIEGSELSQRLAELLGTEVAFDTDANMALAGLTAEGVVPDTAIPVLLNMSTVLTMALRRRDGSMARGLTSSFGNFSLLPAGTHNTSSASDSAEPTLGMLLSTHGLLRYCASQGVQLEAVSELWEGIDPESPGNDPSPFTEIRDTFSNALVHAIRMIAVISDPLLVVLAGRLAPLVELVLPSITQQLAQQLEEPPELLVANPSSRCRSTSHGAADVALVHAQHTLYARLAAGFTAFS